MGEPWKDESEETPETPEPTPAEADAALAAALRHNDWAVLRHLGHADRVAHAGSQWLTAHNL